MILKLPRANELWSTEYSTFIFENINETSCKIRNLSSIGDGTVSLKLFYNWLITSKFKPGKHNE